MTTPETPLVVRSGPIGFVELLRCGAVVTLTNFTPPPHEWRSRWRRTPIYFALFGVTAWELAWLGIPYVLAPVLAAVLLVGAFTLGTAALDYRHRKDIRMWRLWDGRAGAVCVVQWNPRRQRHELHSWAAFPRRRGRGGVVARAAISEGPRPLWLDPATSRLPDHYRSYGFVDAPGTRWMNLP